MKKIMFNDRYHLTEEVLVKYKRQTRRIESRQRYQVGEVVAVAMSYWDNYFGTPEGERLFSLSGTAGMHNKMFVKADEMRHKIRITKAWRESLQDRLAWIRLRKLTPRECLRLMDVDEPKIDVMLSAGISDSQLYKMAGNSIVVACMEGIF